ncbi:hypothetical protein Tco_0966734 [Tanacetum coccineum]
MTEMFSLLKELTKSNSTKKVLVKEEVSSPITKCINAVSLVRTENDKGTKSDMVIDENIVEPVKLVDNEEEMDEEEGSGLEYVVLPSSGYGILDLVSFVVFGECRHRYAVSSLMATTYWLSEQ